MEKWRFVHTGKQSPAFNMALDEAMVALQKEGEIPPTIRFYGWEPATLSIGYFQKARAEVDQEKLRAYGLGFVRRATGGRAVLHDNELTYSIVVPESHSMIPSTIIEAYRVLSEGLRCGFQRLGLQAEMVTLGTAEEKQRYEGMGSAACFDAPSWYELVIEGKKVSGNAQMRHDGILLQHGAIPLDCDVDLLFDLLIFSSEAVRQRMKQMFATKAIFIQQLKDAPVTMNEVEEAFRRGFEEGLGIELVEGELTEQERRLAQQIAADKYGNDDWNFKR
jgi:lipoate-protein ligase A